MACFLCLFCLYVSFTCLVNATSKNHLSLLLIWSLLVEGTYFSTTHKKANSLTWRLNLFLLLIFFLNSPYSCITLVTFQVIFITLYWKCMMQTPHFEILFQISMIILLFQRGHLVQLYLTYRLIQLCLILISIFYFSSIWCFFYFPLFLWINQILY